MLVMCDHAAKCPYKTDEKMQFCSGLKPHLPGYVLDKHCTDEHDCKGVKVKCVTVPDGILHTPAPACSATDLLLAAILLGRFWPLAPHHAGAIRERLRELNDNELREMVATGKWPNGKDDRT